MTGESVAVAAERRWAIVVGLIIVSLILVMVVTGVHWAAMPPSRVETVDPRTLHVKGEFVEANLGTSVGADGKVVVRVVGQQYSFHPPCVLVPAGVPVTFRGTASDVVHGFQVARTNANVMLVPGFIATFTTTFRTPGEHAMPCHEFCGSGHEGMWARVQVIAADEFRARAGRGERLSCVRR